MPPKIYLHKQSSAKILQISHKSHHPCRNINYPKLPSVNSKAIKNHYYGKDCAKSNAAKFVFIHCILLKWLEGWGSNPRQLVYKTSPITTLVPSIKSRGFFSYWHLPGLNPSEPPFDFAARDVIKEQTFALCTLQETFAYHLLLLVDTLHPRPHRLLFTHGFVAHINEANFRLTYLIDLRLVRKPSESCAYSGLPYGARELPALLRQYIA